jgi:hypothetical protein
MAESKGRRYKVEGVGLNGLGVRRTAQGERQKIGSKGSKVYGKGWKVQGIRYLIGKGIAGFCFRNSLEPKPQNFEL